MGGALKPEPTLIRHSIQRLVIEGDDRAVEQRRHHDAAGGVEHTGQVG